MNGGFDFATALVLLRNGHRIRRRGKHYLLVGDYIAVECGEALKRWEPTHTALLAYDWHLAS